MANADVCALMRTRLCSSGNGHAVVMADIDERKQ